MKITCTWGFHECEARGTTGWKGDLWSNERLRRDWRWEFLVELSLVFIIISIRIHKLQATAHPRLEHLAFPHQSGQKRILWENSANGVLDKIPYCLSKDWADQQYQQEQLQWQEA